MDAIARTLSKMSESRRHKCMIFFLFIFFSTAVTFFFHCNPFVTPYTQSVSISPFQFQRMMLYITTIIFFFVFV